MAATTRKAAAKKTTSAKPVPSNSRVRKEITRLNKIFITKSDTEKQYIDGLIKRAAWMRIQLENMEKDLTINGATEMFTQSPNAPPYERERPVARLYNSLNKNYQTIMKQLADFVDRTAPNTESEADAEFEAYLRS